MKGRGIMNKILCAVAFLILNCSHVFAQAPLKELRISAIPDENPQEMLRIYTPFADYLTKEIGVPVKFTPVVDYAATVEGLAANRLDMVWYGGLTSVQAAKQAKGARRIIMRKEDAEFKSHFITTKQTGVKALRDLKGKTFSFGSVSSTSGHLMPRYFLFWEKLVETKKVDTKKVAFFWTPPPYVDYVWSVRGGIDNTTVDKISKAFLKLNYNNPEHKKLLDLHRTKGYIPAKDEDWKSIEEAAIAAGLIKLS